MAAVSPTQLNAAIERAASLLGTDPARAGREAETVLKIAPNDPRALLILGSARRRQGNVTGARAIIEPLAKAYPRAARTQFEYGAILAALGQPRAAITAFRQAVSLNRDLAETWRALGDLLFLEGDVSGSDAAYAELARASITNPALKPAANAFCAGDLDRADTLLREYLKHHLDDAEGTRMLAEIAIKATRFEDAEVLLGRCLELQPGDETSRFNLAETFVRQHKAQQAIPLLQGLLQEDEINPAYRNLLAAAYCLIGADLDALKIYEGLLADYPKQTSIWMNYGHHLRAIGRAADAMTAYRRSAAFSQAPGDAFWSLANMKLAKFADADIAAMLEQANRTDLIDDDRVQIHYALGKALEDRGEYAASFKHYSIGAEIRRPGRPYSASDTTAKLEAAAETFSANFFAERSGFGARTDEPIFIVGLPRAGSTLVEQILASHSQVEGTMELPHIGQIDRSLEKAAEAAGAAYPASLAGVDAAAAESLGRSFIDDTRAYRQLGRARFIDKMPNNFLHLGLICLILPNARIIDARRHPLGSGFSAFKQLFAQGQAFSYDLTDIGLYYRDYVEVMRHFDRVLPGRVHRVIYEDMVNDTEAEVRRLLDYCGLPFEDACLRFYETDRTVRTVSSEQVRQPIFRDGIDQWRNFEPWLDPLKAALGPALESWRG
jgi:predicted Zn-dependent protease